MQDNKIYNPNYYFLTKAQKEKLVIDEEILLGIENILAVFSVTKELPANIEIQQLKEAELFLAELLENYQTEFETLGTFVPRAILDTEHILNMILIGSEHLPPTDDLTLKFFGALVVSHFIHRIDNCLSAVRILLNTNEPESQINTKKD